MSDFVDFYHQSYPRLAAQLSAYLSDAGEAEDVLQEAYLRAWQRWAAISSFDDPSAWVRRVAWNLATSRWRRLTVASGYLLRQPPPEPVDGANPDRVALIGALRDLPDTHRRAVVLHYVGDLSVEDVAAELGVPRGTVLSWLHRSRTRLADLLADADWQTAPTPAVKVVARARRRRTTRLATAIVAILTGATAAAAFLPGIIANLPMPAQRIEDIRWTGRQHHPASRHRGHAHLPLRPPRCPRWRWTPRRGTGRIRARRTAPPR